MDITQILRGESSKDCECCAWAQFECACGAQWPESVAREAADELDRLRAELAELRARVPAICFPRQPNGEDGWVIDANYVAAIHKDCFPIEWQPCEEEVEAVLLAVERAAPVTPAAVPDDVAKYRKHLELLRDDCTYPAGHVGAVVLNGHRMEIIRDALTAILAAKENKP